MANEQIMCVHELIANVMKDGVKVNQEQEYLTRQLL